MTKRDDVVYVLCRYLWWKLVVNRHGATAAPFTADFIIIHLHDWHAAISTSRTSHLVAVAVSSVRRHSTAIPPSISRPRPAHHDPAASSTTSAIGRRSAQLTVHRAALVRPRLQSHAAVEWPSEAGHAPRNLQNSGAGGWTGAFGEYR